MASLAKGVDLTSDIGDIQPISWHDPHPAFVILLVGPEEIPFGIQKDLLCAKSVYYREYFANVVGQVEYLVKLPDTEPAAFGCLQNYLFVGKVYAGLDAPDYTILLGVWKLATELQMADLRIAVLNAMSDRRLQTNCIPGRPLLLQAWKQTEENSGLRLMLVSWAAEHMRSLPSIPANERNEFARGLPLEILSDLVVAMAELPAVPASVAAPLHPAPVETKHFLPHGETSRPTPKRVRKSAPNPIILDEVDVKPIVKRGPRRLEPSRRKQHTVPKEPPTKPDNWTPATDIEYCKDLIDRMIRGPGYWTRLVGPFRYPVDPIAENIPNYFDVVKKPMDLTAISRMVHNGEYNDGSEFEKDIRQIHKNCYEYWTKEDPIWKQCQDFENYFNTQWGERYKWTPGSKFHKQAVKSEVID